MDDQHGDDDQQQVDRIPLTVEKQRGEHQPEDGQFTAFPRQQKKTQQGERKKQKNELVGIKQHPILP